MAALSPASPHPAVGRPVRSVATERIAYVDTIKGIVVAGVIVVHAGMTYGVIGSWAYQEVPTGELYVPVALFMAAAATLGMGVLFLIAGLFTPAALSRKGTAAFLGGRIRRLAVPTLAYFLIVMPALNFVGRWAAGRSPSRAIAYAVGRLRQADLGPAWFLLALLLFTLAYAAYHELAPARRAEGGLGGRGLVAVAVLSAAGMFAVRTIQPVTDPAPINFGVWPQHLAFFGVGVMASGSWQPSVPASAVTQAKLLALAGLAILAPLAVVPTTVASVVGGWHWQSAELCLGESFATFGVAVWVFRQFQRLTISPLGQFARASFPAYLLQSPVTVLFGIALRPVALPVALKIPLLAAPTLVACFALGAFLTRHRSRTGSKMPAGRHRRHDLGAGRPGTGG